MKSTHKKLTIGWLYPELMSTYGDRGNIIVLQKRCKWREIETEILPIDQATIEAKLQTVDLLFGGGAQDHEQELVMKDLHKKSKAIKALIENGIPALFVCGAPQLMGKYYEPAEGKRIEGLGIFAMASKHLGKNKSRLIGNVAAKVLNGEEIVVGFENHGGRTYLEKSVKPFATILKGFGNNGEDKTEGVVYKNAIGCYLHGPLLPKNPHLADYLIEKALEIKYKEKIVLEPLDDDLEKKAQETILKRLGIN
jgi:lipid II isoglutaminyl synthase (glutamine-hydrolysing)